MVNKIDKIKAFKESQNKKRYNVTLDEEDVEEIQLILQTGLSPSLQFIMNEFLEEWKEQMEESGDLQEDPLSKEERNILKEYYKKNPNRFAPLSGLPEMKRRRISKGRLFLIKKEQKNIQVKKTREAGKK